MGPLGRRMAGGQDHGTTGDRAAVHAVSLLNHQTPTFWANHFASFEGFLRGLERTRVWPFLDSLGHIWTRVLALIDLVLHGLFDII